jgi:hypothetical protein
MGVGGNLHLRGRFLKLSILPINDFSHRSHFVFHALELFLERADLSR